MQGRPRAKPKRAGRRLWNAQPRTTKAPRSGCGAKRRGKSIGGSGRHHVLEGRESGLEAEKEESPGWSEEERRVEAVPGLVGPGEGSRKVLTDTMDVWTINPLAHRSIARVVPCLFRREEQKKGANPDSGSAPWKAAQATITRRIRVRKRCRCFHRFLEARREDRISAVEAIPVERQADSFSA